MSDPNAPTPTAAWYPDPNDSASLRWWDGHTWTTHTAARPAVKDVEPVVEVAVAPAVEAAVEVAVAEIAEPVAEPTVSEPAAAESFLSRLEPLPSFTRTVVEDEPTQLPGITYPDPALADFAYPTFGAAPADSPSAATVAESLVAEMAAEHDIDVADQDADPEPVASLPVVEVADGPVVDEFWDDVPAAEESVLEEPVALHSTPQLKLVPVFLHEPEPAVVEEPVVTVVDASAFEEPEPARIALTLQTAPPPSGPAQPGRRMPSHLMPGAIPDAPRAIESSSSHRDVPRFRARARELAAANAS